MIYRKGGKRIFDLSLSICALALFTVPVLLAAVAIKLNSPGPVFFFQNRVGHKGKIFRIYKLRTMTVDTNRHNRTQVVLSDPDLFPVGRFLRRFKIDEMPQIFNVVLGDMSFVGPRPCLEETLDSMPNWARQRFEVRPGITGLAQTRGNVFLSWEKRWEQDIRYVDRLSFPLDVRLVFTTISVIIWGEERFWEMS